jgi:lysophospholipase L1-like esterase
MKRSLLLDKKGRHMFIVYTMGFIVLMCNIVPVSAKNKKTHIVAVGDSITVRKGSYIDILGGKKCAKGKKASYNLFGQLKEALKYKPKYIAIFVGINNPMSGRVGCRDDWQRLLIKDLRKMYRMCRAKGVKVIGITLLPAMKTWRNHYNRCKIPKSKYCCRTATRRERRNPKRIYEKILEVNSFIMEHADIPIDNSDMWNKRGILKRYDSDGIHPNSKAHENIANKIKRSINESR